MQKKVLALVMVLALVLCMMAGCSGNASSSTPDSSSSTADSSSEMPSSDDSSDSSEPAGTGLFMDEIEENATITYWEMQWGGTSDYQAVVQELVDRFNSENEYGIKVDMQMIAWDGYYETFLTAVTSGAAPDVATGPSANPIQYAVMGESLDLDPIMEAWKAEDSSILTEIPEYMWTFYQYEGVQYGIPFGLDSKQILYRSDFFEEAGITDLPTTYDEFVETAQTLKEKFPDKIPVLMGAGDQTGGHISFTLAATNDSGLTTADAKADMLSDKNVHIYEFLKKLYDNGLVSEGSAGYKDADIQKIWLAGESSILVGVSGNFCEGTEIEEVTRVLPNVSGPDANGKGKYINCVNGINGFSQTEYPNASRYFLKWWTENNLPLMTKGQQGNFPARSSYYEDEYYSTSQWRMDTYKYTVSNGQTPVYPCENLYPQFAQVEGEQIAGDAVELVLSGKSVEEALETCNKNLQACIDAYAE